MLGVSFAEDRSGDSLRALKEHPDRFFGSLEVDPNRGMDAVRDLQRAVEELGVKAATAFPAGLYPQVADQRREVLPDLREVHRARHPDLRVRGRARTAGAVRAAVRRPHRRGVLVLPRAEVRHAPRLRAVGRPRGEAAAEVAEPLLLHLRVRAPLLPRGRRQVREHTRRRQGDVRGLLPDGPLARPHLQGDARRCRSATTCGRSSCARTPNASSSCDEHD